MSESAAIQRTAGSMSTYEFTGADESLPFFGVLTVDDGTNASRFQLVHRETMSVLFTVMPADEIGAIGAMLTSAGQTLEEITIRDEDISADDAALS